ncbi:MAG: alanine racemase [Candidatus Acetothermia bacterium]|jgi:alanine racemase|nr:alanine racemase [Candidatus Acetothermia bacterium]MDH7505745.1 alanine racemase [Candidatus Acetothermia bacterium]
MIELGTLTRIGERVGQLAMAEARVDLSRLERNIGIVKEKLAGEARLLFVVKADAYGHGAGPVALKAQAAGVDALGVANLEEALQLRRAGVGLPILVLGLSHPHHLPILAQLGELEIAITIAGLDFARALDREATRLGTRPKVQVKVDTGLGRIGVMAEEVLSFFRSLRQFKRLQVEGVFSHLSVATSPRPEDREYTLVQIERFHDALERLDRAGLLPPQRHISNSAGLIGYFDEVTSGYFNMVRPGVLLYGYPELEAGWTSLIRPVMSLRTWVVATRAIPRGAYIGYGRSYRTPRPSRIAIIPVGYADGLDSRLSNRGEVVICGRRAPIVGRISMDQATVDVTHLRGVAAGEEVELFGEHLPATELAERCGAPCVEVILTQISKRVGRVYLN